MSPQGLPRHHFLVHSTAHGEVYRGTGAARAQSLYEKHVALSEREGKFESGANVALYRHTDSSLLDVASPIKEHKGDEDMYLSRKHTSY